MGKIVVFSLCVFLVRAQPWKNTSLPIAERVASLIGALNLTEKVALLSASSPAIPRLGLPAYNWATECERGDSSGPSGTAFPSGIALGSTFNATCVELVAFATAVETRANYDTHPGGGLGASCFGPVTNFIRDPRWGRTNGAVSSPAGVGSIKGTICLLSFLQK
jgi:beta-glucosidase